MSKVGLWGKYTVSRTDGKPMSADDKVFVLIYNKDWAAFQAIATYAQYIRGDNPALADDLEAARREIPIENFQ